MTSEKMTLYGVLLATVMSTGCLLMPPIQAQTLTWSIGSRVNVPALNQTDADPSIIFDGTGTYRLIRSDSSNAWNTESGHSIDTLTQQYSFNTIGVFAQPNGDDLYWITGAYIDPATGNWYGIVHVEFDYNKWPGGSPNDHFRRIELAESTNSGQTWTLLGDIITPYYTSVISTDEYPGSTFYYGDGDPKLYVDSATGYFYLYYMSGWFAKATDSGQESIYVARAPISGLMAAGTWTKWYNGSFSQPGLAGQESAITNGDSFLVSWNAYLGQYFGVRGMDGEVFLSTNLASETWTDMGNLGISLEWYNWPIDNVNLRSRHILGQSFRLYSADSDVNGVGTQYWPITFTSDQGTSPVNSTGYYQIIDRINGMALGIAGASTQGGASVIQETPQNPPTAEELWQIVSNGDGFYHIVNKNSGQAIGLAGVNGGSNDSWGSDLIQWTYGDYEDQNWCLEVTEGGYYKLCSRNSDQVVGIANPNNQSGSVAITWPDVFGAQDQEFSFVPVSQ
jgi:hypothetical protein